MAERTKKIDIEIQEGESNLSSFGGLCSIVTLFFKAGMDRKIDAAIRIRGERGAKDSEHVLALVLLNLAGGTAVDNLSILEKKLSFDRFGIRIPSPSACRLWLKGFHNASEEQKRGMGQAFIPKENEHLEGWRKVFSELFAFAWKLNPRSYLTLDMDATEIPTSVDGALANYKGRSCFWSLNTYCPEMDMIVSTRYCDGNVPPGWEQVEEFKRALDALPPGVRRVGIRSDSAGYQSALLRYCNENKEGRFEKLYYAISADVVKEFKEAAKTVDEKEWKPLKVVNDAKGNPIVVQEWAEVTYVPSSLSTKKDGPDYRFFAIREKWNWKAYKDAEDVEHAVAKQRCSVGEQLYISGAIEAIEKEDEGIRRLHLTEFGGRIYKLFGVASNIEDEEEGSIFGLPAGETMDGKAIIEWHRKRCGKSEEIHHSLKEELAGGHVPSKVFGANAAWWNVAVLAVNLNNILKNFFLPAIYRKSRPRTLRFLIYTMAGKIVSHGRRIVLKLWERDYGGGLLAGALERLKGLPEPET